MNLNNLQDQPHLSQKPPIQGEELLPATGKRSRKTRYTVTLTAILLVLLSLFALVYSLQSTSKQTETPVDEQLAAENSNAARPYVAYVQSNSDSKESAETKVVSAIVIEDVLASTKNSVPLNYELITLGEWSPNGKKLLFNYQETSSSPVVSAVIDATSSKVEPISGTIGRFTSIQWKDNNTLLYSEGGANQGYAVKTLNIATGEKATLLEAAGSWQFYTAEKVADATNTYLAYGKYSLNQPASPATKTVHMGTYIYDLVTKEEYTVSTDYRALPLAWRGSELLIEVNCPEDGCIEIKAYSPKDKQTRTIAKVTGNYSVVAITGANDSEKVILAGSESADSPTSIISYDATTKQSQVLYKTTPFDYDSRTWYPAISEVRYSSASEQLAFRQSFLFKGSGISRDFGLHLLNMDDLSVKELCKSDCSQPRL